MILGSQNGLVAKSAATFLSEVMQFQNHIDPRNHLIQSVVPEAKKSSHCSTPDFFLARNPSCSGSVLNPFSLAFQRVAHRNLSILGVVLFVIFNSSIHEAILDAILGCTKKNLCFACKSPRPCFLDFPPPPEPCAVPTGCRPCFWRRPWGIPTPALR